MSVPGYILPLISLYSCNAPGCGRRPSWVKALMGCGESPNQSISLSCALCFALFFHQVCSLAARISCVALSSSKASQGSADDSFSFSLAQIRALMRHSNRSLTNKHSTFNFQFFHYPSPECSASVLICLSNVTGNNLLMELDAVHYSSHMHFISDWDVNPYC